MAELSPIFMNVGNFRCPICKMIIDEYWFDIGGKLVPNEERMVAKLLDEDILFLNSRKFYLDKPTDSDEETLVLFININDCFAPAADAESLTIRELSELFTLYQTKESFGVIEFVALKRNHQPIKRIKKLMVDKNYWTVDLEKCRENTF